MTHYITRSFYALTMVFVLGCTPEPKPEPDVILARDTIDFNVIELTIDRAQQAIRENKISCEWLTKRYLERIEMYDQPTGLNAIIYINPKALDRARTLDQQYEHAGTMKKLHCMPVILKDNFDTHDMPTEAGSIAMKGSIPPDDGFMVTKLRESDAIILAKSNMAEWAFSPYHTISSTHGETVNAYDLTRVPAGSSGGSASAIAANFGIIGMGTDTGNSIRGPASHLSLVGIRSTIGATSRDGIVPLLLNRDVAGPMMRTVKDTALVFSILAGYDPADPATQAARGNVKNDYTEYLIEDGLKGVRVGVLRELYETTEADFEILQLMDNAIADLKKAGAVVVDPFIVPALESLRNATGFCSRFRFDLQNYLRTLGPDRPLRSLDEVFREKNYLGHNESAMQWAMSVDTRPELMQPPCVDVQGDPRRKIFLEAVVATMDYDKVDAVIYPTWSNPPRLVGDVSAPHGNNSPAIAPHTGQPAITVPMGFTSEGLPAGLQFLARPFDEHKLFQYAYAYEQQTKHRRPPQKFGALHLDSGKRQVSE